MTGAVPKATIRDLFPSPVGYFDWPDTEGLNRELLDAIMSRFNSSPGLVSSNRKGWHSKFDMHRWPEPCVSRLMAMVMSSAAQLAAHFAPTADGSSPDGWQIKSCWSNVNPPGGYNQPHNHIAGNTLLSGFYYVDIGGCAEPNRAGRTIFQDRSGVACPAGSDPFAREYAVVPKPGALVLFPAALFHYVEPYCGEGLRVSVAFNLSHARLEALYYPDMLEQDWWWKNFRGIMLLKSKVPEKARAFRRFVSYSIGELRKPQSETSLLQRLKVTLDRAEADEAEARENRLTKNSNALPSKRPFV